MGQSEAEYCCEPEEVCLGGAHHAAPTSDGVAPTADSGAARTGPESAAEQIDGELDHGEDGFMPRLQLVAWSAAHRHGPVRPRQRRRRRERPPHRWC